jgi:hypothetical protein
MTAKISKCKTVILDSECCDKTRYFSNFSNFPPAGEEKVLYVDESTGDIYIWDSESSEYIKSSSTPSTDCCCYVYIDVFYENYDQGWAPLIAFVECGTSPNIIWQTYLAGVWTDITPQPIPNNILEMNNDSQGRYRVRIPANDTFCCDTYSNVIFYFTGPL